MSSITIRNLGDSFKQNLRVLAALHGRSMEEEARTILRDAVQQNLPDSEAMLKRIRSRFATLGDVNLVQPPREPIRDLPGVPVKKARKRTR
ncbi:MAG: plasmid stabilization protein [Ramlibacter sp.]|nr:plasmid stabilization protein [Ramlibacter sp.]